jgi:hypothetical protein
MSKKKQFLVLMDVDTKILQLQHLVRKHLTNPNLHITLTTDISEGDVKDNTIRVLNGYIKKCMDDVLSLYHYENMSDVMEDF